MKFTESMLETYSQPLSATEDAMCKNSIRMIADALKDLGFTDDGADIMPLYSDTLAYSIQLRQLTGSRRIKLFVQGSYANNTNVRTESDVDIAVIQEERFRTEYRPQGTLYPQSDADYNFSIAPSPTKKFKDEVQECLEKKFTSDVERKNKSIKVHGNTYRKDADSVPCLRYRDYRKDFTKSESNYIGGIVIYPDDGGMIINYPEQHIANGRKKNVDTNRYYKKMVRIMKKMRYLMEESSCEAYRSAAKNVSSFVLESLLWNVADTWYLDNCPRYRKVYVFSMLIQHLQTLKDNFSSFKEANGIKPLCPAGSDSQSLYAFLVQLSLFYSYE